MSRGMLEPKQAGSICVGLLYLSCSNSSDIRLFIQRGPIGPPAAHTSLYRWCSEFSSLWLVKVVYWGPEVMFHGLSWVNSKPCSGDGSLFTTWPVLLLSNALLPQIRSWRSCDQCMRLLPRCNPCIRLLPRCNPCIRLLPWCNPCIRLLPRCNQCIRL